MGGPNTKLFTENVGRIKIVSIIIGAIAVFLTADYYFESITEEKAFFWSLVVCLIISAILAILSLVGILENANANKIDKIFHALAAIVLIITACFFIVSVDKHKNTLFTNNSFYARRAAAGAFGLLYGVICGYIGWFLF